MRVVENTYSKKPPVIKYMKVRQPHILCQRRYPLMDGNSLSRTKWNCKYHIVFAPKYRRKIVYGELNVNGKLFSIDFGN